MPEPDAKYLDILQDMERAIAAQYALNDAITDVICIFALGEAKIAIKQKFGFAKGEKVKADPNIQGMINGCVEVGLKHIGHTNKLTLREYVNLLERLQRSAKFHSERGPRGYYNFISHFV